LDDLRNEEKGELHRMQHEDTVCVLQGQWVIEEPRLEETNGQNWGDRCKERKVLKRNQSRLWCILMLTNAKIPRDAVQPLANEEVNCLGNAEDILRMGAYKPGHVLLDRWGLEASRHVHGNGGLNRPCSSHELELRRL